MTRQGIVAGAKSVNNSEQMSLLEARRESYKLRSFQPYAHEDVRERERALDEVQPADRTRDAGEQARVSERLGATDERATRASKRE